MINQVENVKSQYCDSEMHFLVMWTKNMKISPNHGGIKNLIDLRKKLTNIQKRDRALRRF